MIGSVRRPEAPPQPSNARSALPTVAIALAGMLTWQAVEMLLDLRGTASRFQFDGWLDQSPSRLVVFAIAVGALVAAGLLLHPRTRRIGALIATVGLAGFGVYLGWMWIRGDPVQCLCQVDRGHGSSFSRGEAIVIVAAVAAIAASVALATRSTPRRGRRQGGHR